MTPSLVEGRRESIGQAPFSVSARVALQLGRESISSPIIAVLELVKNAYDADAENVWVSFSGLGSASATLIIEDDGDGMDQADIVDHWMLIGTDNKLVAKKSGTKRRVLVGEKGLGRLGLDRLADACAVQSFPRGGDSGVEVEINWSKYEATGQRLETVYHPLYRIPKAAPHPVGGELRAKDHGMRLVLRGLKDAWSHSDLEGLRQELALLVSPFYGIDDFTIWLESGMHWSDLDGRVSSGDLLDAAEWTVVSAIDDSGNVSYRMFSTQTDAEYTYLQPWSETFKDTGSDRPRCGSLEFRFYFFLRKRSAPSPSLTQAQVQQFLKANQGIRIYRDGFRIMPYGEPSGDGDWLNLSLRRTQRPEGVRQGGWRVGYNQVVGAVFLTRQTNGALIDQTNRERLIEGDAYYDLRRFALRAIEFFEKSREQYESEQTPSREGAPDATDKTRGAAQTVAEAAGAAVTDLRQTVGAAVEKLRADSSAGKVPDVDAASEALQGALARAAASLSSSQRALQQSLAELVEEQEKEKNTLANLASLGILAATFGHESLASANLVTANVGLLKDDLEALLFVDPSLKAKMVGEIESLEMGATTVETFAKFILNNIKRDKRQRKDIRVSQVASTVFSSFSKPLEARGILVSLDCSHDVPSIRAFPIDWESIFINFITNAVWALEDTRASERKIRLRMYVEEGALHIQFADSGRGLEAGTQDRIFLPTFSTKRNKRGDVIGTGLGLAIVQHFVHSYGGTIAADSPSDLGGAEFHIEVPLRQ